MLCGQLRWWGKVATTYKKYCFNNLHFVKENRINFAVLTFFICIFKCRAICFSREHVRVKTWKKVQFYSRKFSSSKIFHGSVSGKFWQVFSLPWWRRTCQIISHCIGAWNPWKLDNNEEWRTSQEKREVNLGFAWSPTTRTRSLQAICHPT